MSCHLPADLKLPESRGKGIVLLAPLQAVIGHLETGTSSTEKDEE
jgi:hypothetical protein